MFAIEIGHIDLDKMYKTPQGIRWQKIGKKKYAIPNGNKIVLVEQTKNWLKMTCNEEEFWNIWYYYFDMGYDYAEAAFKMRSNSKILKKAQIVSSGLRIANMDIFESLVVNILLEHYPRKEVKLLLNNICSVCSNKRKNRLNGIEISWYEFPSFRMILDNAEALSLYKIYDGWEEIMFLCMFMENGTFNPYGYKEYKQRMQEFKEFGIMSPKTANMICLYGYNMKEAFPMDNHLKEVMYLHDIDINKFNEIYDVRGLASRYLLYYEKNVKKFAKSYLQMAKEVL